MARPSWSERLFHRLVAGGTHRRALAGFAALSVGDFFLPALPTQTAVIALSLLQPRRAAWIVAGFATAAAAGALLMAALVTAIDGYAQSLVNDLAPETWAEASDLLRRHGAWIVLAASIFPTPPRVLVIAALLAGTPAIAVAGAVFAGKVLWFGVIVALLVTMPTRLHRVPWLGTQIRRLDDLRRTHEHGVPE
jgi:membrane protein YqaA with SNARE-associated domain